MKLALSVLVGTLTKRLQILCFLELKESLFSSINSLFKECGDVMEEEQIKNDNTGEPLDSFSKGELVQTSEINIALEGHLKILSAILENLNDQEISELDGNLLEILLLADHHMSKDINVLGYFY